MHKLNSDQLQQLYFENSPPTGAFHDGKQNFKPEQLEQSFFDNSARHERISDDEIARFERFFSTFVYQEVPNYDFTSLKTMSMPTAIINDKSFSLENERPPAKLQNHEDRIFRVAIDDVDENTINETTSPATDESVASKHDHLDDDLAYLDALINPRVSKSSTPTTTTDTLSELLTEIIDNEKDSVSNYESATFNSNVQLLFDEASATQAPVAPLVDSPATSDNSKTKTKEAVKAEIATFEISNSISKVGGVRRVKVKKAIINTLIISVIIMIIYLLYPLFF